MAIHRAFNDRVTLVLIIDEAQGIPPKVLIRLREILNFEAEAEGITTDHIIDQVLKEVPKDAANVAVRA